MKIQSEIGSSEQKRRTVENENWQEQPETRRARLSPKIAKCYFLFELSHMCVAFRLIFEKLTHFIRKKKKTFTAHHTKTKEGQSKRERQRQKVNSTIRTFSKKRVACEILIEILLDLMWLRFLELIWAFEDAVKAPAKEQIVLLWPIFCCSVGKWLILVICSFC